MNKISKSNQNFTSSDMLSDFLAKNLAVSGNERT
jgi:hypothetical protein